MKKTILCHFYNEEYLLPWWLKHHRQFFDHGIMINYASTDNSVNIIKELCPTWEIVESKNKDFIGDDIDTEVAEIEKNVEGWRICLNVTEFLLGNFSILTDTPDKTNIFAPVVVIVDEKEYRDSDDVNKNEHLYYQFLKGMNFKESYTKHKFRALRNFKAGYTFGRHYKKGQHFINDEDHYEFIIFKCMYAPMTEELFQRKMQIQHRMPYKTQYMFRAGDYHTNFGRGLTKEAILEMYRELKTEDLSDLINKYIKLSYN